MVKAGFIADPAILDLIEADPGRGAIPRRDAAPRELIQRSIRVKAEVVSADLREDGPPARFSTTATHLPTRSSGWSGYAIPHGQAVSIGMVFVAGLGRLAGRLDAATATRHRTTLAAVGLPVTYGRRSFDELLEAMRVDKKARGSVLRFVVLDGLAEPAILTAPDEKLLRAAFDEVSGS